MGGVVFDGFIGSGTTAIACIETGRKYIGYEIDPEYYKIAQERLVCYNKFRGNDNYDQNNKR